MMDNSMKIGLFVPCCVDQYAADTAEHMYTLLTSLGLRCSMPQEMTCCGRELYNSGDREGAKSLGETMIGLYNDYTHIVACGSACVTYIKTHFGQLFHNTTLHNDYRQFANRCYDLSDFLVNVMHYTPSGKAFPHKVLFMDHCATMRDYLCLAHPDRPGLREEPRQLLGALEGVTLVEAPDKEVCCGYGGQFANHFTIISNSLAHRKIENALNAGAEYIVSTEMSCLLHLQSVIDKEGIPLQCKHLADLLV